MLFVSYQTRVSDSVSGFGNAILQGVKEPKSENELTEIKERIERLIKEKQDIQCNAVILFFKVLGK